MADETKRIEALFGPMAGSVMDIPTADADQAVTDGWARNIDPYDEIDPEAPLPDFDPVAHETMLEAAIAASKKLHGIEDEVEGGETPLKAKKGAAHRAKEAADARNKRGRGDENKRDEKREEKRPKEDDKAGERKTAIQAGDDQSRGYETRTSRPKAE